MVLFFALALRASTGAQEPKKAGKEPTPKPQVSGKEQVDEKAEEKTPAFKGEKGEEFFRKGRELFEGEKYKEALAELKRSKELAKTQADKELVQTWISACEGGVALDSYRKEAQRGAYSRIYFYALDSAERYRSTPIAQRLNAFVDEIGAKALVVLENFDAPSARYSEKFGKRFIGDPKIVFRGSHCLEWTSQKDGKASQLRLKAESMPDKWTPFQSIVFWVRWERPVDLVLLALSPGKVEGETNALEYTYSPNKQSHAGWERVQVDLQRFKPHGSASFANVQDFMLQIDGKTTFKFNIDEIALVRKDKAEAGAGETDSKDSQDKKQKKQQKKTGGAGPAKQTERKKS